MVRHKKALTLIQRLQEVFKWLLPNLLKTQMSQSPIKMKLEIDS